MPALCATGVRSPETALIRSLPPYTAPTLQGCTLPGLRLSAATWRALLGQPQQAQRDLAEAEPQLHRGLQYLHQLAAAGTASSAAAATGQEDGVASMGLHFAVHDAFGREVRRSALQLSSCFVSHGVCLQVRGGTKGRLPLPCMAAWPSQWETPHSLMQMTTPHPLHPVQVELCQGGSQQLVTAASLERYIALLAQYKQVLGLALCKV